MLVVVFGFDVVGLYVLVYDCIWCVEFDVVDGVVLMCMIVGLLWFGVFVNGVGISCYVDEYWMD